MPVHFGSRSLARGVGVPGRIRGPAQRLRWRDGTGTSPCFFVVRATGCKRSPQPPWRVAVGAGLLAGWLIERGRPASGTQGGAKGGPAMSWPPLGENPVAQELLTGHTPALREL